MAAVKLTGDPSRVGNSTDEDLKTGELDLESRDSLQLLALLTGVLTRLSGVLVALCGVLRNLSGVLGVLSGVKPAWLISRVLSHVWYQVLMTGQADRLDQLEH